MKAVICLMALICVAMAEKDWTRPPNGKELNATLRGETDKTWMIMFTTKYEDESSLAFKTARDMEDDVKKNCSALNLVEKTDYIYFEVNIEMDGTNEKDQENLFGPLLVELGFESGDEGADPADGTAGGDTTGGDTGGTGTRRQLQGDGGDGAGGDGGAAGGDGGAGGDKPVDPADKPVPLTKLAKEPYTLVMRNQQGYRVSGKGIPKELCAQAKKYKDLKEDYDKALAEKKASTASTN